MAVNYCGKKFYNIGTWRLDLLVARGLKSENKIAFK
jgi:hypothetical protein